MLGVVGGRNAVSLKPEVAEVVAFQMLGKELRVLE